MRWATPPGSHTLPSILLLDREEAASLYILVYFGQRLGPEMPKLGLMQGVKIVHFASCVRKPGSGGFLTKTPDINGLEDDCHWVAPTLLGGFFSTFLAFTTNPSSKSSPSIMPTGIVGAPSPPTYSDAATFPVERVALIGDEKHDVKDQDQRELNAVLDSNISIALIKSHIETLAFNTRKTRAAFEEYGFLLAEFDNVRGIPTSSNTSIQPLYPGWDNLRKVNVIFFSCFCAN